MHYLNAGDGPSAATYARKHGKANRIYCKPRFLSHEELAQVYASSDVHVSASEFETLGNTVLEAFACGIPVVVPRSQGFCDTVAHAHNGFLFTPKSADDCRR
jgi:glycosyltransferase involved in cell wall biosynthesis